MKNCHLTEQTYKFFEGWYLKHQKDDYSIAFIPGLNITKDGLKKAFIQIITKDNSYMIEYDYKQFFAAKNRFYVKIGNNIFCDKGVLIDIHTSEIRCAGKIVYGRLTPPKYDVMGPLALLKDMECNHGVLSMHHTLKGFLTLDGKILNFGGGSGYIEKDWGTSFPRSYTWIQCNDFDCNDSKRTRAVMVSIADIIVAGKHLTGLIAIVHYKGKEYRFATYNGGKVLLNKNCEVIIQKGRYKLAVSLSKATGKPLKAPGLGEMNRTIRECPACRGKFDFYRGNQRLFSCFSENVSYEYVN